MGRGGFPQKGGSHRPPNPVLGLDDAGEAEVPCSKALPAAHKPGGRSLSPIIPPILHLIFRSSGVRSAPSPRVGCVLLSCRLRLNLNRVLTGRHIQQPLRCYTISLLPGIWNPRGGMFLLL